MSRFPLTDAQPIDRLEEKVLQLVALIDTLRAERGQALQDVARLQTQVDTLTTQLTEAASTSVELSTLREEREAIRNRVSEMLAQIDKLEI